MAKKKAPASAEAPPAAAPAVAGADPAATTKKKPANALMAGLMAKAKTPAPTVPSKKARPTLRCETPEEATVLDTFTAADMVFKVAKGKQEDAKAQAYATFTNKFLIEALKLGYIPDNPNVVSEHSKASFIVKHMTKMKSVDADGNPINVAASLAGLGFNQNVIGDIVGNEEKEGIIKVLPQLGMRKFTDLTADTATDAEKKVADKVMALLAEHLDDDEKALVLETSEVWEVDPMWQDKAVAMAKAHVPNGSVEQQLNVLKSLFRVIAPQFVMSHMNYTGELSVALGQMQATLPPREAETDDIKLGEKIYRAKIAAKGEKAEVQLFLVKPDGGEEFVKMKPCDNFGHGINSVKIWKRQPDKFKEFVGS